jgi:DNA primase
VRTVWPAVSATGNAKLTVNKPRSGKSYGRISEDIKEEILDRTDLVALIGDYTALKKSGARFMGLCPFPEHKDKDPSFSVNPEKGFYYCFGCQQSGNAITFVQRIQGLNFLEALEYLARRAGVVIPTTDSAKERLRESLLEILEEAGRYYETQLRSGAGQAAREFLTGRGLTDETIEKFRLGFAPSGWENVGPVLLRKGAREGDLQRAGLIVRREGGGGSYDRFRNRIMFPIWNRSGRVIAFGARRIDPEDEPKYLNSPESDLFKKGATLYAYHLAKSHIHESREACMVEGYMDVISLHQHGFQNVVATLGTAMTVMHWKSLERLTDRLHLLFDADSAGVRAALRGIDILLEQDVSPRIVLLEEGTDPDSFIREKGSEAFREVLERSEEAIDFRLREVMRGQESLEGEEQINAVKAILPTLSSVKNRVRRTQWVRRAAQTLRIREEDLFSDLAGFTSAQRDRRLPREAQGAEPDPAFRAKEGLIALLLADKPVHNIVHQLLEEAPARDQMDRILESLVELIRGGERLSVGRLERTFDPEALSIVSRIMNRDEPIPEKYPRAAKHYAQTIRQSYIAALDAIYGDLSYEDREAMKSCHALHARRVRLGMGEAWRA